MVSPVALNLIGAFAPGPAPVETPLDSPDLVLAGDFMQPGAPPAAGSVRPEVGAPFQPQFNFPPQAPQDNNGARPSGGTHT